MEKPPGLLCPPTGDVSYQWGNYTYGPYQIYKDATAVPDDFERSQGIEIRLEMRCSFGGAISRMPPYH